jgi:hypothetical protein
MNKRMEEWMENRVKGDGEERRRVCGGGGDDEGGGSAEWVGGCKG